MTADIRRGTAADADALVVLRAALFESMREDAGDSDAAWRRAASSWFRRELTTDTGRVAVLVADDPDVGVVSCAMGVLELRAPSPGDLADVRGHVSMVSTLPEYRRRGLARVCFKALLAWFDDEIPASRVDLHATGDGDALYRSLGFVDSPYPSIRRIAR